MYRAIETSLWTDPRVRALPTESKLLFLYLITNPHGHVGGIYYLPNPVVIHETGFTEETLDRAYDTLSIPHLAYRDRVSEVVWVKNMLRYQGKGPKIIMAIQNHLETLHHSVLIPQFLQYYKDLHISFDAAPDTVSDTLSTPNQTKQYQTSDTVSRFGLQEQEQEKKQIKTKDDAPRVFMQFLNQVLTTKTGSPQPTIARGIYGLVIAHLRAHPEQQPQLSTAIDLLPKAMPPEWYVQAVRAIMNNHRHEQIKEPMPERGMTREPSAI